jgi:hypothetical protein
MSFKLLKILPLVFVMAGLLGCSQRSGIIHQSTQVETPFIVPPVPGVNVGHECFEFDAEEGTILSLANGTRIVIPPSSLEDMDGKPVTGLVSLAYREFHDATDILVSGIPMGYDSAGVSHQLETAGMFEMEASQNGHPVFLQEGSQAQVNLASFTGGNDYNFYYLDKEKRNWQYEGQRDPEVNYEKVARMERVSILKRKNPYLLREGHFVFDYAGLLDIYVQPGMGFNFDEEAPQASESSEREKVVSWRTRYKAYESHLTNKKTESTVLNKAADYGLTCLGISINKYITFLNQYYPASMMVWKLIGKPIPSWADTAYRKELTHLRGNVYQLDITATKGGAYFHTQIQAVMPIKDLFKIPSQQWKQERKEILAAIEKEEARVKIEADILRSFEIRQFGIYNWDRFAKEGPTIALKADFDFGKNVDTTFFDPMVFYLPGSGRSVVKYPQVTWQTFQLPDDNEARMVCVLPENRVAVFSPEEFAKIDKPALRAMKSPTYTFEMKVKGQPLASAGQLRGVLGF